jgi:hypothetical protein
LLTASLASRNVESVNTTSTALPRQQVSSTSEKISASSSQPADGPGAIGGTHSTDLVSRLPSKTTHDVSLFFLFIFHYIVMFKISSQPMHYKR